MKMIESGIEFNFVDGILVEKFDDTNFYRNSFNKLPSSKGVDFIAKNSNELVLIEVKNCIGNESDNRWRIAPNNKKVATTSTIVDTTGRESLDIEISKKIAMTLACLCGANSKHDYQNSDQLKPFFDILNSNRVSYGENKIKVILFLEGNFSTKTRPEKKILKDLQDSIKTKLSWLNCHVLVENINTHKKLIYSASAI